MTQLIVEKEPQETGIEINQSEKHNRVNHFLIPVDKATSFTGRVKEPMNTRIKAFVNSFVIKVIYNIKISLV